MTKRLGPFYLEPDPKDGLVQTIEKMYERAHREQRQVLVTYNGIVILIHDRDGSTVDEIAARYQRNKASRRLEEDIVEWPVEHFHCLDWSVVETNLAEANKISDAGWRLQGLIAVRYASSWARLMDAEIETGKGVDEIALETFLQVNTPILSNGYVYISVICLLYKVWPHGKELMLWHHRAERTEEDDKYDGWPKEIDWDEIRMTIPKAIKERWQRW